MKYSISAMSRKIPLRHVTKTKITGGFLDIPLKAKAFYSPNGHYVVKKEESSGYNYVAILPEQGIREFLYKEFKNEGHVDDFLSKSDNLEARIKQNGVHSLKIPENYLQHLHLEKNSKALILMFDYLRLWNLKEFLEFDFKYEKEASEVAEEFGL